LHHAKRAAGEKIKPVRQWGQVAWRTSSGSPRAGLMERRLDRKGRFALMWATRWSLFLSAIPTQLRAVMVSIAVLPTAVVVSRLTRGPALSPWLLAAAIGVAGGLLARGTDSQLPPKEKRLAAGAVLTGAGTGDPNLDAYALGVLEGRRRVGQSAERVALGVVILVLLAAPMVAGVTSGRWWLLMVPLEAALVASLIPSLASDIDTNIRRLEATARPPRVMVVWDGARRVGPVSLGMSLMDAAEALPGTGFVPDDDPDPLYFWESEELGLSLAIRDDKVIAITAELEFVVDGQDLIDLPEEAALWRAGGETSRDGNEGIYFISTVSGLDVLVVDGFVSQVSLAEND
jgi:hypothetical protein